MVSPSISHYRILKKLGAGGMGEVFLAEDMRLDRQVALKILPPKFAQDKDRMSRFVREAKSASALNHPNIITVYDIGEADGTPFIVTELLEGEELRSRLKEGAIAPRNEGAFQWWMISVIRDLRNPLRSCVYWTR